MSQTTTDLSLSVEIPREDAPPGLIGDLVTLTKARLSLLVIITTFVGYCWASPWPMDWLRLLNAVLGTTLAAAAAAVLNQFLEAKVDRLMDRTRDRPLPAGRVKARTALLIGCALSVAGVGYLWLTTNALAATLAALTIFVYIALYTPMKRMTSLCTLVGAVSGAIPPMIGWAAARPSLDAGAWILFGILFAWQMPHFLAIAWMYRDEYAQAGFVMIQRDDASGTSTAFQSVVYSLILVGVTMAPFWAGMNSDTYLAGALLLDAAITLFAVQFLFDRSRSSARQLFFSSIVFLPLLLGLLIVTKI